MHDGSSSGVLRHSTGPYHVRIRAWHKVGVQLFSCQLCSKFCDALVHTSAVAGSHTHQLADRLCLK